MSKPHFRVRGKQPDKNQPKHEKAVRKKIGKRVSRLAMATRAGVVDKAQRPFAIFCKLKKMNVRDASKVWKELPESERSEYVQKSKESFLEQRRQSAGAGVLHKRGLVSIKTSEKDGMSSLERGVELGSAAASSLKKNAGGHVHAFAAFCKVTRKAVAQASKDWKNLSDHEKEKYKKIASAASEHVEVAMLSDNPVEPIKQKDTWLTFLTFINLFQLTNIHCHSLSFNHYGRGPLRYL